MTEKSKIIHSLTIPVFFLVIIWSIKLIELAIGTQFIFLGIYPLKIEGLLGIITAPLIHDDIKHLLNNSVPFFILSVAVFYFYRPLGLRVLLLTWVMTGIWVWCGARQAYHIGASGVVYGLASFLFFSGAIRRRTELAAVSLIVIFLYGSMIWGIFPFVPDVSWESHMSGGIAGLILAVVFRNLGPQRKVYEWENEIDEMDIDELIDEGLKKQRKTHPNNNNSEARVIPMFKDKEQSEDKKKE
jgi:membrane associated rhomboid family serine protease